MTATACGIEEQPPVGRRRARRPRQNPDQRKREKNDGDREATNEVFLLPSVVVRA
jgi:hypothetical protein